MSDQNRRGAQVAIYTGIGLAAGCLSGLFGVGGGLIIVPLLLLAHHAQKRAQATSLAAIIVIAAAGAVPYALRHGVDLPAATMIAVGGLAGSLIGSAIVLRVSDHWLKIAFALVALASAVQMVTPHTEVSGSSPPAVSLVAAAGYLGAGLAMGTLSGLVGVGGGIVLVPVLVFGMGLAQPVAQGLSLVVMVPIAIVGAVRGGTAGNTDWFAAACIGIGGAIASPFAAQAALELPTPTLRILFALLLLFAGVQIGLQGVKGFLAQRADGEDPDDG